MQRADCDSCTRSEWPGAVSADVDGRGRKGAVRLPGRRLGPEDRAGLKVILAAQRVAHNMRVRRYNNPLLALRVLDHDARLASAGERRADRTGRLHEAIRHAAIGCAEPPFIIMAAVGLWPGEDAQFDSLLAA